MYVLSRTYWQQLNISHLSYINFCHTWRDVWLNEGFTTYLTYRIMEDVYGVDRSNMERVLGYQELQRDLADKPLAD